jgi:5-methyltetrahydropteroyltriglutamate--homocysteine methyltransferase
MLDRRLPPFRADHVGSLLRPAKLKEARAKSANGEISQDELARCEDQAIEQLIREQEEIGLQSVTDGELRREMWHWDFLAGLDGVQLIERGDGVRFAGVHTKSRALVVTEKIGVTTAPMLDHFEFLRQRTKNTAKMTIPSPAMLFSVARDWRPNLNQSIYATPTAAFDDLAAAYRSIIQQFYDAGCRYLQLDECNLPMLCDPSYHDQLRQRGDDPDLLIKQFSGLINASLKGRPTDMSITIHTCRGNFQSKWMAEGSYDAIAEYLFGSLDVDGFFAEYDTDRSGGFEPLRFLPRDKLVVLGLVSSKEGELESADKIKSKIEQASRYVDLSRLCLSPQCGFSSSEEGNVLTEDQQWRKLAFVKRLADEVWS